MADPTIYSYTVQDAYDTKATIKVYVAYDGATETAAALAGNWTALGGHLDALIDGKIIGGSVTIPVLPDGSWKSAPVADSIVERTGLFNFAVTGSKYRQGVDIPSLSLSVLNADGTINLAASAVTNFVTDMTDNIGGSHTVFAQNAFELALTALIDAVTTFRKHRRQLTRSTTETP